MATRTPNGSSARQAPRTSTNLDLASHPGGTVKIGQLVDTNLETEYRNLYVCDCSVIPEAWGLPPELTIVGLGKRLARHLAAEPKPTSAKNATLQRLAS